MGRGIDYGMGQTNIDKENGIRYGVIPMNSLAWADEAFEPWYGDPTCPKCGGKVVDSSGIEDEQFVDSPRDYFCHQCNETFYSDRCFGDDPLGYTLDDGEYKAEGHSDGDVFVTKSPYFTRAQFCSPCAPGACHLENPMGDGERAYCFGHDWFENEVAPYPVYSVTTGELVLPPQK